MSPGTSYWPFNNRIRIHALCVAGAPDFRGDGPDSASSVAIVLTGVVFGEAVARAEFDFDR